MDTSTAEHGAEAAGRVGVVRETLDRLRPGEAAHGGLRVGCMASGQPIAIPFTVLRGRKTSPCLWLNGAVHGDELNGVLAVVDYVRAADRASLEGSIVATPVCNPLAFDARRKRAPQDELDLDQSYPGKKDGLASERQAWRLFAEVEGVASALVNFHTMNPLFDSRPYAVYKAPPEGSIGEADILGAIACFEPVAACRMPVTGGAELPGNVAGGLDNQALLRGILAFMIELGGGSRQEPDFVRQGIRGIERLAARLGVAAPEGGGGAPSRIRRVTKRRHVQTGEGGLFRYAARPGVDLPAGTPLGHVHDFAGRVRASFAFDGTVLPLGIRTDPVVHSGDRVAFVATEWSDVDLPHGGRQ